MDTAGLRSQHQYDEEQMGSISSDGSAEGSSERVSAGTGNEEPIVVVFVVEEGKAVLKPVKTGIQDNTYIEVTEGLDEDAEIVVAPYSAISRQLKNEQAVEVVTEEELLSGDGKKKKNDN
jgi:HlyD family secretion protein